MIKLDDKLQKKWDAIIHKNKEKWAKDLYKLILKGKYWDVSFDRYTKYRVFIVHFEPQIKELLEQSKKEFPEMEMNFEDIAHDLFLSVTEEEGFVDELEEKTKEIIDMLPKA